MLTDKLLLALAITLLTVIIAAINAPQGVGKADQLIPMNHAPAETACNVG
jgi:hypothetical protein